MRFVYDKSCKLLDDDFYGKNICKFKVNKCIHDRLYNASCDGCCKTNDGLRRCKYLENNRCKTKCLACKFHICHCIRQKGYKYIYNWKQKIIVYSNFFMTPEEVLDDVYKNSLIYWAFKKKKDYWVKNK